MISSFRETYDAAVDRIATDLTGLLGETVQIEHADALLGEDGVQAFAGTIFRGITRRMDGSDADAGMLFGAGLATRLGATLLMMPPDSGMTEEVTEAFSEILTAAVRSWSTGAPADDQLDEEYAASDVSTVTVDELRTWLATEELEIVVAQLTIGETTSPFGFFGPRRWLHGAPPEETPAEEPIELDPVVTEAESAPVVDESPHREPDVEPTVASAAPSTSAAAPTGSQAVMMVIDRSGALNEWLIKHMEEGTLQFKRPGEGRPELDERSTLVVLGPDSELFRTLRVDKCVVADKPPE